MTRSWSIFLLLFIGISAIGQSTDRHSELVQTFTQLQDEKQSIQAADHFRAMSKTGTDVQNYLANKLPNLIEKNQVGPVWLNAVRLAGNLKLASAAEVLATKLEQENKDNTLSFSEELRLENDPVGKALVEIGDPAVRAVARTMQNSKKSVRWRAILVLTNIDSQSAQLELRRHLGEESDPDLRRLIIEATREH